MATTTGRIEEINLFESFCCVRVLKTTGTPTYMLLWSYPTQPDNAKNRLLHGMYFSLARDAHVHNRTVRLGHTSGSAFVTSFIVE
ncbi:MAG: hypothetical protein ACT4P5_08690 [Armatimonadota bacterium]